MSTTATPSTPAKTHPVYAAITELEKLLEPEVHGQTKHAAEGSFSSLEKQLQGIVMAGSYAKALLLIREAKALIPATYEDYFADAR